MGEVQFAFNFRTLECGECGIVFAMTASRYRKSDEDGKKFFCPNGHGLHFVESSVKKLEKQLAQEKQRREWAEGARDAAQKRESNLKGQVTKIKNRVSNGVCPCCNRTFQNLLSHMKTKHPDFKE